MNKLNWAVLGTGVVANQMAQAMQDVGRKLYAVGNRTHSKAVDFANKYGIEKVYEDLNDMFYDDNVDVIYITSPHNTHIDFIMKALEHGKHILCEKSITLNSVELEKALKKADGKNLVLAEAMTIYHMPLYKKLMKLVADGEIGDVSMIQANFGSYKDYDMKNRFFNMNLAGGSMLDKMCIRDRLHSLQPVLRSTAQPFITFSVSVHMTQTLSETVHREHTVKAGRV